LTDSYPLAPHGIFRTVQGEGYLLGTPMVFVRLAGCSVGCYNCDTDYRVLERLDAATIARKVAELAGGTVDWVWVTGGEPTDHNLAGLMKELRRLGPSTMLALATAGHKHIAQVFEAERWDWLSVSPHHPAKWQLFHGSELKLVPGLDSQHLADFEPVLKRPDLAFCHKFVSPCAGMPETVRECQAWVESRPGWRMTTQAHKAWNLP
jgi:7-carboxy-7-deazaguanine synthase